MMKITYSIKPDGGFTLIELIGVIVILGILSAVALPKIIDMSNAASVAKIQGAYGAAKSAYSLAIAKWAISGGGKTVTLPDGSVINFIDTDGNACGTAPSSCGCFPSVDSFAKMLLLAGGGKLGNFRIRTSMGSGSSSNTTINGWTYGWIQPSVGTGLAYFAAAKGTVNATDEPGNITCGFTYSPPSSCNNNNLSDLFILNLDAC